MAFSLAGAKSSIIIFWWTTINRYQLKTAIGLYGYCYGIMIKKKLKYCFINKQKFIEKTSL